MGAPPPRRRTSRDRFRYRGAFGPSTGSRSTPSARTGATSSISSGLLLASSVLVISAVPPCRAALSAAIAGRSGRIFERAAPDVSGHALSYGSARSLAGDRAGPSITRARSQPPWIISAGMSAPTFSVYQRAAPGCHIMTVFAVPEPRAGSSVAGAVGLFHHALVVRHHRVDDAVDEAFGQVAVGDGEVPHRHRTGRRLERGVRSRPRCRRRRPGRTRMIWACSSSVNSMMLMSVCTSSWETAGTGHAGREGDHVEQAVLQLAAEVCPAAVCGGRIRRRAPPSSAGSRCQRSSPRGRSRSARRPEYPRPR